MTPLRRAAGRAKAGFSPVTLISNYPGVRAGPRLTSRQYLMPALETLAKLFRPRSFISLTLRGLISERARLVRDVRRRRNTGGGVNRAKLLYFDLVAL